MNLNQNKTEISETKQTDISKIKILTIFFAVFIIGVVGIFAMATFFDKATSITIDEATYQYFGDGKSDHSSGTVIQNSKISNILLEDNKSLGLDSTPIYSYENKTIYTPINYAYCSIADNLFWRIPEFTKIQIEDSSDLLYCSSNECEYSIRSGFMFDGGSNYVFLNDGKVIIDDFEEYPVTPFSFFSKEYDILRVYDYINNEYRSINKKSVNVVYVSNSGYSIDLIKGIYIDSKGNKILLVASPSVLNNIEESVLNGEKE